MAAFLAGPLGFEPRQSAPKALDLPLVDGPVGQFQLLIYDFRLKTGQLLLSINNQKSTIENLRPVLPSRQRGRDPRLNSGFAKPNCRFFCLLAAREQAINCRSGA
jgi:hypothetical protein